tara:strand:- start:714 stop:1211 length:498 start_codon:yes stop_codon:yes gene_type:complete
MHMPPRAGVETGFMRMTMRLSLVLCCAATVLSAHAQQTRQNETGAVYEGQTRLATDQITEMFSNVIDRGEVQDGRGISAETHWFADGTFVSRWWSEAHDASAEGAVEHEVTGRWRTERDLRCVIFGSETQPDWSCAEVWLLADGRVLSLNPDGSVHGLHRLSPLK